MLFMEPSCGELVLAPPLFGGRAFGDCVCVRESDIITTSLFWMACSTTWTNGFLNTFRFMYMWGCFVLVL